MSKLLLRAVTLGVVVALLGVGSYAIAGGGTKKFEAQPLNGYEENPDVSSLGTGSFEATLARDEQSLRYELSYSGLEGNVTQGHIHFGKRAVNGGISIWLCSNLASPPTPAGVPACPQSGTVSGEVDATDVVGPAAQLIDPGELDEIVAAMRAGHAYANVHTSRVGSGEIRAQINDDRKGGKKDDD
jgi:hypothetical protein